MTKILSFFILFLIGLLVFFVGGYWSDIPHTARSIVKTAIPLMLFAATMLCGRVERLRHWKVVLVAFLAASSGFLFSWWLADPFMKLLGASPNSVSGVALAKFVDSLLIVVPVVLVARIGGIIPADLYLRKGNMKVWLTVGSIAFVAFLVLFILQSMGQGLTMKLLLTYAPWTLVFIFSNAFMEELHFRGLFLRPFEQLIGRHASNLCVASIFTLVHAPVKYTPDILVFLTIVFLLSLAWGYIIQKTSSLWGSVLFHAGADLLIVVGIYTTYGAK